MNPEYRKELEDRADRLLDRFNIYIERSEYYIFEKVSYIPEKAKLIIWPTVLCCLKNLILSLKG